MEWIHCQGCQDFRYFLFAMQFSHKWFLFIESSLLFFVAWVWILSWAFFPAMTSYLERSRDAARIAWLMQYKTALQWFYADNEVYPTESDTSCIPGKVLQGKYLLTLPTDPSKYPTPPCNGDEGMTYAYRTWNDASGKPHFLLSAHMEDEARWNSPKGINEYSNTELLSWSVSFIPNSGQYYSIFY